MVFGCVRKLTLSLRSSTLLYLSCRGIKSSVSILLLDPPLLGGQPRELPLLFAFWKAFDMEIRHLRYFVVVAEELHFGRAANRLHMDSSPLSRAIKELEDELGVRLFERDTRRTHITGAGTYFLGETRRLFALLEQARTQVRAVAQGMCGSLRIGFSDGLAQAWLAEAISGFRSDEPGIDVRVVEMSFVDQVKNLRAGLLDVGLARANVFGDEIAAEPVWQEAVVAVLPATHSFASRRSIALPDIADQPLVLCHPECGSGCYGQIDNLLRTAIHEPRVAEFAATAATGVTLVASGYGIGFMGAGEVASLQRSDIAIRPLIGRGLTLTTYLLRSRAEPTAAVKRFIRRLHGVGEGAEAIPGITPQRIR